MKLSRSLPVLVCSLLALSALSAGCPAAAQPPPLPPVPQDILDTFSEAISVQAVNVDVVVTDAEGNRVPGLTAADFRLLVEGQEVALESFAEVRDGQAVAAAAVAEAGNNYLIFIDELFSNNRLRDEALQGIAADLRSLGPKDQVAIVAVNRERAEILSPWTRGGPALDRLLARMIRHTGSLASSGLRLEDPGAAPHRVWEAYQNHLDRLFAEQATASYGVASDAQRELRPHEKAMAAATASLRAFSGVPGRKLLLLLSGGWLADPRTYDKRMRQHARNLLQPLVDTANRQGFTVYPVHLVWTVTPGFLTQVVAGLEHGSLQFTAVETGGKLLKPGRNRHLGKVAADTSAYYRLGFSHTGDDQRRGLEVEVRRPGLQVRSPESFVPLSRQGRVTQQVDSALLHGALTGMAPLTATAGELRKTADGRAELPVTLRIPVDQITLLLHSGRQVGQLELRMAALADDGSRTVVTAVPIWVLRDEAARPGEAISYQTKAQVEHKPQHVQLVLVDVLSGKSFGQRLRVEPVP